MKQTAVEWLVDYLKNIKELPFIRQNLNINEQNILNDIIEQAKEMERQQIIQSHEDAYLDCGFEYSASDCANDYYNKKFKL
jgi:fructose/tagatose bisphosphate aldolase